MERWDPFGDMVSLRDAMDRLVRESFVRPGSSRSGDTESFPIEVGENADGYIVRAYLPGVKPEDTQVTIHGDLLTIRGETQESDERNVDNWIVRERRSGSVQRSVRLPSHIDADRAEAHCENGVMLLTLPKAESAKPRRIPIGGTGQQLAAGGGQTGANASGATDKVDSLAAQRGETRREDVVTEGSDLSFPASDPPSWNPGHTGAAEEG